MSDAGAHPSPDLDMEREVVRFCRDLIRIDTTNTGEPEGTVGEALAAEYVESVIASAGFDAERFTTTQGHRQGVVTRIPGRDPQRGALLVHGHLDVVPAKGSDWSVDPFSAEIRDGMIWGRGAVDMKDMDAMILANLASWGRSGQRPERDLVVLFTPDEEAGGRNGAHWLVDNRPELFAGVTECVGEVGGFSLTIHDDLRLYLIQVAEKGLMWLRLRATGAPGHGSMVHDHNAVTTLAESVAAIGRHRFPQQMSPSVSGLFEELSKALGRPIDPTDEEQLRSALGPLARIVGATLHDTANPTMLSAGYKVNVLPESAEAQVDGRYLPGGRQQFIDQIDALLPPGVTREFIHDDVALETSFDGPTIAAMSAALTAEDAGARPVPYMLSGGTDAKAFSRLGIRAYGFAPLRLPPDLDFASLFHGVDERVPIESLQFGARVLQRFLLTA